jgi:GWxTD domain-containing protein
MKTGMLHSVALALLLCGFAEVASAQHQVEQTKAQVTGVPASSMYEIWLAEDVKWIITDRERAAFNRLTNDEERNHFVENFWSQRDPTPDTVRNEFKESHYQRMLTARQRFSSHGETGWDTAQGRMYVMHGPPDDIETKVGAPALSRQSAILEPACDVAGTAPSSYELWHYNRIRGIDHAVSVAFAELCPNRGSVAIVEKADADWLSRPPVPKYKLFCDGKVDPNVEPTGSHSYVCAENPPRVQFKDLSEIVSSHLRYSLLPYEVHVSFEKVTEITAMLELAITIKNSDVTCSPDHEIERAPVRIFGRLTTEQQRVAYILEDSLDGDMGACSGGSRAYKQWIPLLIGQYRLNLVLQDVNGDRIGTFAEEIEVPKLKSPSPPK